MVAHTHTHDSEISLITTLVLFVFLLFLSSIAIGIFDSLHSIKVGAMSSSNPVGAAPFSGSR